MTGEYAGASTRVSRVIRARPEEVYAAFLDPAALVDWLPPAEMTGEIHEFDARVGGGYRMSLFYPPNEHSFHGKTSDREDMVNVRFVELMPPRRIAEAVNFVTTDPAFLGEMTLVATFEEVPGEEVSGEEVSGEEVSGEEVSGEGVSGGTEVTLVFKDLPPGLRAEDNEAGARLSLEQLARRLE